MADTKISALTAVITPATTDEFAVNQSAVSKKITLDQVDDHVSASTKTLTNKTLNTASNTVVIDTADVTTGTFADARVAESNVTQHEAALTITESQISDLTHTDATAIHDNIASEISAITAKATPVSGDFLVIEDSAAANVKKSLTYGNLQANLSITESQISDLTHTDADAIHDNVASEISAITEKVSPASGDFLIIEDSDAANVKKRVQIGNLPTGGGGEANTASNSGAAGVGVWARKTGIDLEFKNINAGSSKITITDDTGNDEIDIDVAEANIDHGTIGGLTDDDHTRYSDISSQAGAPSSTPSRVGNINVDTTADRAYISTDSAGSGDWDIMVTPSSTDTLTNKTIAFASNTLTNVMSLTTAQSVTAGIKKTLQASATNAGIRLAGVTANPSALVAGDLWYRTDTEKFTYRGAAAARSLVAEDLAQTLTNKTINTASNTLTIAAADITTGTLAHERGGLEADVSAFGGVLAISGGTTTAVNTKALLEAQLSDVTDIAEADGDVYTGDHDFGGAGSLEIPNSATPTVNADGEIALDTTVTDFSHGILKYFGGEELAVISVPIAELTTPTNGHVVAYNATNDEFELVAAPGGGSPGGSDTEVQYNNGGAFGGMNNFNWNDTTDTLTLGATVELDAGGATSLEIPNGAAPTVDAAGEIAVDTTITDHTGLIKYHDGVEELTVIGLPTGNLTTTDGHIVQYNATNNEFEMAAPTGGSDTNASKVYKFDAAALQPLETAFAPLVKVDEGTAVLFVRAFDDTTQEYVNGKLHVPADIDTSGTVNFKAYVYAATAASSVNVGLDFDHRPINNSEAIDGTYTTESSGATAIDATQDDITIVSWSETVSNLSWAANELVLFRLSRDPGVSNDLTGDMYLVMFTVEIPRS